MSTGGVFDGVRVIELAQFVYVPGAGVMLADQGAEVIKIETIDGDPYRTLKAGGDRNLGNINIAMEQNNRNKKSIALDLKTEEGREALLKLVETADVFLTSLRPKAITALRLDVEDLRARNPRIIYARGNGVGFKGPEANRPGFDASAFWARGGAGYAFTRPGQPLASPRPAFGDHTGSMALAYGIAAALFRRATSGEPSVVENSLLATATWVLSGDLTLTQMPGYQTHMANRPMSPLMTSYTTRDGKMIQLMILHPDSRWEAVCDTLGIADLVDDPRFATQENRVQNAAELIAIMQEKFGQADYADWKPKLEAIDIPWELISSIQDVVADPQVRLNGMMQAMAVGEETIQIVAGPTAFDSEPIHGEPACSPELGAHTEALLREVGYDDAQIAAMRESAVAR